MQAPLLVISGVILRDCLRLQANNSIDGGSLLAPQVGIHFDNRGEGWDAKGCAPGGINYEFLDRVPYQVTGDFDETLGNSLSRDFSSLLWLVFRFWAHAVKTIAQSDLWAKKYILRPINMPQIDPESGANSLAN